MPFPNKMCHQVDQKIQTVGENLTGYQTQNTLDQFLSDHAVFIVFVVVEKYVSQNATQICFIFCVDISISWVDPY